MSGKTTEQLQNRYITIHMELLQYNGEIQQRLQEADGLKQSIEAESAKPAHVRDEGWILAQKRRLTYCQDTTRIAYEMARLYQEVSAILIAFAKREIPVLYSVAVTKGLTPGAQARG